jgi:hypothetical protein
MNHYLYKIINKDNGKYYIGVHSFRGDYYDSKYWGSGCFSKDARKNPEKYLRVLICQAESRKEVLELEALFVTEELVDDPMCYNLKTGGLGGSHAKRSAETKAKLSAAQKGRIFSDEHKAKLSASGKGRTLSDKHKAKLSAVQKGRTFSDESKAKMSAAQKGRTFSDESKAKMSAAQKGKILSDEHKAKLSAAKKDMPKTECPHCQKIGSGNIMKRWHFDNCRQEDACAL